MQVGQVLMTVAILQYGVIPPIADFNRSHAANPDWPPHARFHVVAQVMTTSLVAVLALGILWWPEFDLAARAGISALASATVLGGFFAGTLASRCVGGEISASHPARLLGLDGNIVNFAVSALLTLVGWLLIY